MTPRIERALGLDRLLPLVRAVIGAEIDRLIAMRDALDPEPDMEDGGDAEPILGWHEDAGKGCPPSWVYRASADQGVPMQDDDREEENEHGGDVVDEPHDDECDNEHDCRDFLCNWSDDPDTPQVGRPWWAGFHSGAQAGAETAVQA